MKRLSRSDPLFLFDKNNKWHEEKVSVTFVIGFRIDDDL
jgi:hypothetical protein